jgi:hypothetical protein
MKIVDVIGANQLVCRHSKSDGHASQFAITFSDDQTVFVATCITCAQKIMIIGES